MQLLNILIYFHLILIILLFKFGSVWNETLVDETATTDKSAKNRKVPNIIKRKFDQWVSNPGNLTYLYHSLPVEKTHVKDDIFIASVPPRKLKSPILNVQLWMELPSITKQRKIHHHKKYFAEIIPILRPNDIDNPVCFPQTYGARTHFPEDILEIKFDITPMYKACRGKPESGKFKFRFRFFSLLNKTEIDLTKEKVDMFLLFREHDKFGDIMQILPKHIEPLHHYSIMRTVKPQLKALRPKRKGAKSCGMRRFIFNFDRSDWKDYVIAPKMYQSNNCRGRCDLPFPDHLNATNHVVIRAFAYAQAEYKGVKNPCCTANELAPLTMLVRDENNKIVLKSQKEMIALNCKCA